MFQIHFKELYLPDYVIFIIRFIVFALIHSLLATTRVKEIVFKVTNSEFPAYRLLYNLLAFIMFVWVMSAYHHSPVLYFVPGVWSLVMYLLQLATVILLIKALQQTGAGDFLGFRQFKHHKVSSHLITTGFYSIVRHPLYLFSTIFLALNPVMTIQWMLLTILSILYFLLGAFIEEKRLHKVFGCRYENYCRQVPFIIPGLNRGKTISRRDAE